MSFKPKRILMKTFVESQFQVIYVSEFQKTANSYEEICWVSVSTDKSLWVSHKSEFFSRYLLSLRLKLSNFTSFKQKPILMKTFVEPQFEVIYVYDFQIKANSYEDICWVSVWSYVSLWVSNKSEFSWRRLLSFSFKFSKSTSFKQNLIVMPTFV